MQRISRKIVLSFLITAAIVVAGLRSYENLENFIWMSAVTVGLVAAGNLFELRKVAVDAEGFWPAVLPVLYLIGLMGTVAASSTSYVRVGVVVIGAYIFYAYQRGFPNRVPQFLEDTFSMLGTFFFLVFVWSLNFFFSLSIPGWALMLGVATAFFLNFRQLFYKLGIFARRGSIYALLCALVMAQVTWAILYWPVNFLTASVTSFTLYYLIYTLGTLHFRQNLNRDKLYFQIAIILVVLLFSLISSPWRPVL